MAMNQSEAFVKAMIAMGEFRRTMEDAARIAQMPKQDFEPMIKALANRSASRSS